MHFSMTSNGGKKDGEVTGLKHRNEFQSGNNNFPGERPFQLSSYFQQPGKKYDNIFGVKHDNVFIINPLYGLISNNFANVYSQFSNICIK